MTGFESKREAAADKLQEPVREALKLGLEALENMCNAQSNPDRRNFPTIHDYGKAKRACIAIKEALAQPAQEPRNVRERWNVELDGNDLLVCFNDHEKGDKCQYERYSPQREWVGLTDDEVNNLAAGCHLGKSVQGAIYEAAAKLKEKNG